MKQVFVALLLLLGSAGFAVAQGGEPTRDDTNVVVPDRVDPNDAAGYDECDPPAESFSLLNIMGGQKDGGSIVIQISNELTQLPCACYIDSGCGFIQK